MRSRIRMTAAAAVFVAASVAHIGTTQRPADPPLGLDLYLPAPDHNPLTPARIALGERLFVDPRLSADGSLSCASCHQPSRAFTDGRRFARGVAGHRTTRSVPSILNAGYGRSFFWDGRSATLEDQVLAPITAAEEMGADLDVVVDRLAADVGYRDAFRLAFDEDVDRATLARALASFVRSRRSGNSAYDRHIAGDPSALDPDARAGLRLFQGKARCVECHVGPLLSDGRLHNTGVGWGGPDAGRAAVTGEAADRGRFKTPSLRNVDVTAPYMHDGRLPALEDVVEFYVRGGTPNPNLDPRVRPLDLTDDERRQLTAYLRALTSEEYERRAEGRAPQAARPRPVDVYPAWSPDGQWIAFHSERDGNSDIYLMRRDGTGLRRLTPHAAFDGHPHW